MDYDGLNKQVTETLFTTTVDFFQIRDSRLQKVLYVSYKDIQCFEDGIIYFFHPLLSVYLFI